MKYKKDWNETKDRFKTWWNCSETDRPLLKIISRKEFVEEELEPVSDFKSPEDKYLNIDKKVKILRNRCKTYNFMADAYPSLDTSIGPGSMALYIGSEPIFQEDTVWFKECVENGWDQFESLKFDAENYWYKKHIEMLKRAKELSGNDFLVNIPDIVENIDILSVLRGAQAMCYDLIDEPELVKDFIRQVDNLYFKYYDSMYNITRSTDGSSSYVAFNVWGPGRTAKVQCDFSAIMSPDQYREFIQPSIRKQCSNLDFSIYHLDGPDAIRHIDAIMEINELNAIQWTVGAGNPDGGDERWYSLYDKVRNADKALWIRFIDGGIKKCVENAEKIVKRYGSKGLYLHFPVMEEREGNELLKIAESKWS